jgi:hypothetical protein
MEYGRKEEEERAVNQKTIADIQRRREDKQLYINESKRGKIPTPMNL